MKKIVVITVFILGSFAVQAQELVWQTNINKAMEISNKTKKPMLLFFTGSDWCGWCIRLQKEVLKTPEFAAWANKNVVLVELDYPRRAPQSEEIKSKMPICKRLSEFKDFLRFGLPRLSRKEENQVLQE